MAIDSVILGLFLAMQEIHVFVDTSPVGQKSDKFTHVTAKRPPRCERGTTFWELGPWGGALFARVSYKQRAKKLKGKLAKGKLAS